MNPIEALEALIMYQPAWMKPNEPWFRHADKIPKRIKEALQNLKSEDLQKLRWDYAKQWAW